MTISLSKEERDRFAAWLEQEAETDKGMLTQMEKLTGMEPVKQRYKMEVIAALTVARKLRNTEEWSVR